MQALLGAVFNADTAVYAGKRVVLPGGPFGIHGNTLGRALAGTGPAEVAVLDFVKKLPACALKGLPGLLRVKPGGAFREEISEHIGRHAEHSASPYYLSVQLMHGSMDRVITGTSASSIPGSMLSRAGILANVGVLIRSLSRFLLPFPFI